jgi:hypothetical protein
MTVLLLVSPNQERCSSAIRESQQQQNSFCWARQATIFIHRDRAGERIRSPQHQ